MDPAEKISNLKQQIVAGQSIQFPANLYQGMIIECQSGNYWIDLEKFKNITCLGEKWSELPPPCIGIQLSPYFSTLVQQVLINSNIIKYLKKK